MFQSLEAVGSHCGAPEEQIKSSVSPTKHLGFKKEKFAHVYQQERVQLSRSGLQNWVTDSYQRVKKCFHLHGSDTCSATAQDVFSRRVPAVLRLRQGCFQHKDVQLEGADTADSTHHHALENTSQIRKQGLQNCYGSPWILASMLTPDTN